MHMHAVKTTILQRYMNRGRTHAEVEPSAKEWCGNASAENETDLAAGHTGPVKGGGRVDPQGAWQLVGGGAGECGVVGDCGGRCRLRAVARSRRLLLRRKPEQAARVSTGPTQCLMIGCSISLTAPELEICFTYDLLELFILLGLHKLELCINGQCGLL